MSADTNHDTNDQAAAMSAQMAAKWAEAIAGMDLSGAEAEWFATEVSRGAAAIERAAAGRSLFDMRMAAFDEMLRTATAPR